VALTNVVVRHRCGCERSYQLDVPAALVRSMAEQLMGSDCGYVDCPRPQGHLQRLLARTAAPAANGKGES
jgi:hypothetical protein